MHNYYVNEVKNVSILRKGHTHACSFCFILHAWNDGKGCFFPIHNNVVCKSQQGEKYKEVIRAHMGIWRRPCAQMMILFGMGVSDVGEGER
jgi:hypothetical protein